MSSLSLIILMMIFYSTLWLNGLHCQHMSTHHYSSGYRRQINVMRSLAQKAYEHGIRINEEAQCSKPRPQLIYLNDSKKIYLPRATLLHRCSDLFGCCPHATHSCEPSRVEKVQLYFFVIGVQSPNVVMRRNQNIEHLTFINHTECACQPIDPMWTNEPMVIRGNDDHTNNQMANKHDNITAQQVRTIRDQAYGNHHIIQPSYVFNGRNHNLIRRQQDYYKENENVLKYWAKMFGFNADNYKYNYKKRQNKRNITKKIGNLNRQTFSIAKAQSSNSHVLFSTPEVTYSYTTIHDNNDGQLDETGDLIDSGPNADHFINSLEANNIGSNSFHEHVKQQVWPNVVSENAMIIERPETKKQTTIKRNDETRTYFQEQPLFITYPILTVPFQ